MEDQKGPVVIPPQQPAQPVPVATQPETADDTGKDPYVPPVEKQPEQGAGSEVSDGEDA
jgi:hypothetical protein